MQPQRLKCWKFAFKGRNPLSTLNKLPPKHDQAPNYYHKSSQELSLFSKRQARRTQPRKGARGKPQSRYLSGLKILDDSPFVPECSILPYRGSPSHSTHLQHPPHILSALPACTIISSECCRLSFPKVQLWPLTFKEQNANSAAS